MRRWTLMCGALVAATLALSGCGDAGSSGAASGGSTSSGSAAKTTCSPVAGDELVVLEDDKKLQTVDNLIPAINKKQSSPELVAALDKVSAALTTDGLVALNKSTDIERTSPQTAAKEFAVAKGLLEPTSGGSGKVVVGAANFSENQTVANLYASALNAAGFQASVRAIGSREIYEPELEKGNVTVVPEYLGTLTEFLNKKANGANPEPKATSDVAATTEALTALGKEVGLTFGKASQAADQNAFAVTKAFADKYQVSTLSELGATCAGLVLGGPPECPTRPFCQPGLAKTYGMDIASFQALDAGGPLSKTALKSGKASLALVLSSDASLAAG